MKENKRIKSHQELCAKIHELYVSKNSDYGNSYAKVRDKYPIELAVMLNIKLDRYESLLKKGSANHESIEDTLFDIANYCLLELVELQVDKNKSIPGSEELEVVSNMFTCPECSTVIEYKVGMDDIGCPNCGAGFSIHDTVIVVHPFDSSRNSYKQIIGCNSQK